MAYFVTNRIKNIFTDSINHLREDIGRVVIMTQKITSSQKRDCPNCGFDNLSGKSNGVYSPTNPYPTDVAGPFPFKGSCPICKGEGTILKQNETVTQVRAKAFVKHIDKMDEEGSVNQSTPAGVLEHATVRLKFNIKYIDAVKNADYLEIDGIKVYTLTNPVRRGLGDISSFVVYCSENLKYAEEIKRNA
jgi:hypothetical protein